MNELTVAGGRVGGMVREFGMDVYTLLYLKCVTTKALLDSTGTSCSMSWGSLDGRGAGGGRIHVCVWLSPFAVHLKLSQHCQLATLQYKIRQWTVLYLGSDTNWKQFWRLFMLVPTPAQPASPGPVIY